MKTHKLNPKTEQKKTVKVIRQDFTEEAFKEFNNKLVREVLGRGTYRLKRLPSADEQ